MKLRCLAVLALSVPLAACGGDDEQRPIDAATQPIDAADGIDAQVADAPIDATPIDAPIDAPSSVQIINGCTGIGNPDLTISAASGAYVPATPTIQVNDVVRFEPGSTIHDMTADNNEFETPLGEITCLRFTAAGSFPVHCSVHGFTGTITVQ